MSGCGTPRPQASPANGLHVSAASSVEEAEAAAPAGADLYRIDGGQSELRVLAYRAGPMAKLGHDHVIVNTSMRGWVAAGAAISAASFWMSVPIAAFRVDDAEARAEEGAEFAERITDDAREGTWHNMLSPACLDAQRHPNITVVSRSVSSADGRLVATLVTALAGHEATIIVPFAVQSSAERVVVQGSVVLRQTELGLVPFSILLGALQVQDAVTIKFKLVALKS